MNVMFRFASTQRFSITEKPVCDYITTTHISPFTDIQYKILPTWKNNLKEGGSLSKIIKMG